jgi:hypothetical protein
VTRREKLYLVAAWIATVAFVIGATRGLAELCEPQSAWLWGVERCQ